MLRLENAQSLIGLFLTVGLCWAFSENRRQFPWRIAIGAVLLQLALVLLLFGVPQTRGVLLALNNVVDACRRLASRARSSCSATWPAGPSPSSPTNDGALFVFAFQVLPLILVISALSALLWHWKILKWITHGFGFAVPEDHGAGRRLGAGGGGQHLPRHDREPDRDPRLSRQADPVGAVPDDDVGLATVAGSTMVAYATILRDLLPNAAATCWSPRSSPRRRACCWRASWCRRRRGRAARTPTTTRRWSTAPHDAIASGTADGLQVVLNIGATLIVFVALVALVNIILGGSCLGLAASPSPSSGCWAPCSRRWPGRSACPGERPLRGPAARREADPDRVRRLHRPGREHHGCPTARACS